MVPSWAWTVKVRGTPELNSRSAAAAANCTCTCQSLRHAQVAGTWTSGVLCVARCNDAAGIVPTRKGVVLPGRWY